MLLQEVTNEFCSYWKSGLLIKIRQGEGNISFSYILFVLERYIYRDLAEHLRSYIDKAYRDNKFEADPAFWDRQYLSLKTILNNENKNKYKRSLNSSATGLTAEHCNSVLSNEFLKELAEEESSVKKYLPFKKF